MDRAHHLATAGVDAVLHQEPVKIDALVAQRIALVHTDHHRRQALDVFAFGKARPGQRITRTECLDASECQPLAAGFGLGQRLVQALF